MHEAIITMKDVTKTFPGPVVALDRVSLTIQPGEWAAVMGASGSGKTTLLNLLGCLDRPTQGHIAIDGIDIGQLTEAHLTELRREKVGLIFQQFHLIPYLTAVENVISTSRPSILSSRKPRAANADRFLLTSHPSISNPGSRTMPILNELSAPFCL